MDQRNFHKTLTALLLAFAYILLLVHNLVPHHHEPAPETHAHLPVPASPPHAHEQQHAHDHPHDQEHAHQGHENPDNPNPEAGHSFSHHQHAFADNKIHHLDTQSIGKESKKQVVPVLVCFLSFHHHLLRIPDPQPDPPPYLFPPGDFAGRALSLRGPPLA